MYHYVDQGYAVVAADYIGFGVSDTKIHPYLQTRTEGAAVVDALHTAQGMRPDLSKRWISAGGSQGGHSALAAAHRAAGDPNLRGTVALEPASNLSLIGAAMVPGLPSSKATQGMIGYGLGMLAGLKEAHPELAGNIDSHLTPVGQDALRRISTECEPNWVSIVADADTAKIFSSPVILDQQIMGALNDYLAVPTSGYTAPIFLAQGFADENVPFPLNAALAAQLTAAGQPVTFHTYPGNHFQTPNDSKADADAFMAGLPA